jgi:hypothetical protein
MLKVEIIEIDRDYNAYCGSEWKEFKTIEEAHAYCKKASWSGYDYMVGMVLENTLQRR